jgi:hypothetical protein
LSSNGFEEKINKNQMMTLKKDWMKKKTTDDAIIRWENVDLMLI